MNEQHRQKLIERFEALPEERIDMSGYMNECGTVGCIAGWNWMWFHADEPMDHGDAWAHDWERPLAEDLDIEYVDELCDTPLWPKSLQTLYGTGRRKGAVLIALKTYGDDGFDEEAVGRELGGRQ